MTKTSVDTCCHRCQAQGEMFSKEEGRYIVCPDCGGDGFFHPDNTLLQEVVKLREENAALTERLERVEGNRAFAIGDRVTKTKGSKWTGRIVGFYSTALTPVGYCVESETETGSVQIYPEAALVREGK